MTFVTQSITEMSSSREWDGWTEGWTDNPKTQCLWLQLSLAERHKKTERQIYRLTVVDLERRHKDTVIPR